MISGVPFSTDLSPELSDSAAYPANSDVDICIVLHGSETPG